MGSLGSGVRMAPNPKEMHGQHPFWKSSLAQGSLNLLHVLISVGDPGLEKVSSALVSIYPDTSGNWGEVDKNVQHQSPQLGLRCGLVSNSGSWLRSEVNER